MRRLAANATFGCWRLVRGAAYSSRRSEHPRSAAFTVSSLLSTTVEPFSSWNRQGFDVSAISAQELAESDRHKGKFAAICLFQTLEHIADVHGAFRAMRALLREDGALFISVPFGPSTELQEELTAYWDLPPNHVGRWTPRAFDSIAQQHGFRVVEWELEATSRLSCAWRLATYALLAKAYDETSLPGRINALRVRSIRGPLKRVAALAFVPRVLKAWHRLSPPTQWVRMEPSAPLT